MEINNQFETWYGKIRLVGNSYVITIPKKVMVFAGYKEGHTLKAMTKKNEE